MHQLKRAFAAADDESKKRWQHSAGAGILGTFPGRDYAYAPPKSLADKDALLYPLLDTRDDAGTLIRIFGAEIFADGYSALDHHWMVLSVLLL